VDGRAKKLLNQQLTVETKKAGFVKLQERSSPQILRVTDRRTVASAHAAAPRRPATPSRHPLR
jgi:hypothetical protein